VFDDLTQRAVRSTDTTEKRTYLLALARATDPAIAARVLALSLTDSVPRALAPNMILAVAEQHPRLAFDFAVKHFDAVATRLDSFARIDFVPRIAANGTEGLLERDLAAFAGERIGAAGSETVGRARSAILFGDEVRRRCLPQVDAWLAATADGAQ
jgi:aminopeptidase N